MRDTIPGKALQHRGRPQDDVFAVARAGLTVTEALRRLGRETSKSRSLLSPLRDEKNPSFSIFDEDRAWKDHGTGEGGDVVELVKTILGGYSEAREWLGERLGLLNPLSMPRRPASKPVKAKAIKWPGELVSGTEATWDAFARSRELTRAGVRFMVRAGILRFLMVDGTKCFAIMDETARSAEIRRMDRGTFGQSKAYPLLGVDKSWLPGSVWLKRACPEVGVLVVEGATDFLSAYDMYSEYRIGGGPDSWIVISILGAACKMLDPECAKLIRSRHVRLVPDADEAGERMLAHWKPLFLSLGCPVDFVIQPKGTDLTDNRTTLSPETLFTRP